MTHPLRRARQTLVLSALALCAGTVLAQTGAGTSATGAGSSSTTGSTTGGSMSGSTGSGSSGDSMRGSGMGMSGASGSAYGRSDAYSLLPFTRRGYVGISVGRPEFGSSCGAGGFACDDPDASFHLVTGGLVNDWLGAEIGYMNTGSADRAGGRTRAQGINLAAVLRLPLGAFNTWVKGGGMYAETRVSADAASGVPAGKRRGWAPTYGVGVGFDFTPNSGVMLEWMRHELRFPGIGGRQDVDTTSLGYVYRF